MFKQLDMCLKEFSTCFRRTAAYHWFVTLVVGFIVRRDVRGMTSLVRCLNLSPKLYETMLHFFRASSWSLEHLQKRWVHVISKYCPVVDFKGYTLLVGDGIKVSKEAKKMPAVKKLHQESENSGKSTYIFGHHFGFIGILVGNISKLFCVPVSAEIHEGIDEIHQFQGKLPMVDSLNTDSVVTRMLIMAKRITGYLLKPCILIIDAYYATGPAFKIAAQCVDSQGSRNLHILTRAKMNTVAYEDPKPRSGHRGRPPVRGVKVILKDLFTTCAVDFQPLSINIYGKKVASSYFCIDLLWRPIMKKVRFVLVKKGTDTCILISSNLDLLPQEIIRLYSYRFKIEVSFKELKHRIGSFFYHFWTHAMPKLDKYNPHTLKTVTDKHEQQLIIKTVQAIEGFVNIGCISIGLLQTLAINFSKNVWKRYPGWLRTITSETPSENTVRSVLEHEFYHHFCNYSDTDTFKIITDKQREEIYLYSDEADNGVA